MSENINQNSIQHAPLLITSPLKLVGRETPTRERADAVLNRQRIMDTARRLFAERGVEVVTMKDIAEAAGVGKGTLYRHFSDKGDLAQELASDSYAAFQAEVLNEFGKTGLSNVELLKTFAERMVYFIEDQADLLKASYDTRRPGHFYYGLSVYTWQKMIVVVYLRRAERDGEIRPDLDLEFLGDALLAPLQIDLFLFNRRIQGYSPERIVAGLHQLLEGLTIN